MAKKSYEVSAGEFKAHCLRLMEKVRATRRPIVITKRGKPVARLVPVDEDVPRREIFGCMKGTLTLHRDIISPIVRRLAHRAGAPLRRRDEDRGRGC
jgi:prevent-host-death family protein